MFKKRNSIIFEQVNRLVNKVIDKYSEGTEDMEKKKKTITNDTPKQGECPKIGECLSFGKFSGYDIEQLRSLEDKIWMLRMGVQDEIDKITAILRDENTLLPVWRFNCIPTLRNELSALEVLHHIYVWRIELLEKRQNSKKTK